MFFASFFHFQVLPNLIIHEKPTISHQHQRFSSVQHLKIDIRSKAEDDSRLVRRQTRQDQRTTYPFSESSSTDDLTL